MSTFTKFLNLFKWQPDIDGDEEFDIDKSLNENWDKIDTKLETYMTELSNDVEVFKNNTDTQVEEIGKQVNGLREISISPTQPTSNESVWIKTGKNRFNLKKENFKNIGVDCSFVGSEVILNGSTSEAGFIIDCNTAIELEAGDYNFSIIQDGSKFNIPAGADFAIYIRKSNGTDLGTVTGSGLKNGNYSTAFTLTEKTTLLLHMFANSNNIIFDNYSLKMQIIPGLVTLPYEKYIEQEVYIKNDSSEWERFYSENELSQQNYSATEQKIGTWRDGKPLYRKTIVKENIGIGSNNVGWADANIDKVTKIEFTAYTRGGDIISNNFNDGTTNMGIKAYVGNSAIDVWFNTNIECALVYFILEYTKTTD